MIKQILEFIQNHWMLSLALVGVLGIIVFEEIKNKITGIPRVLPQKAVFMLNRENAIVLDIRSPGAFSGGHILGAINIAQNDLDQQIKKLESHQNQTIILVDDREMEASKVGLKLQKAGFSKLYVLAGGLSAWKEAQLPLGKN